jgi:hypothetical protein
VFFYSSWSLSLSYGIDVAMKGHSLCYEVKQENPPGLWLHYLYAFSVISPLLFNTRKMVKIFGASVLVAFIFSFVMLNEVYFSVWCLMCAWLTLIIYFSIERPGYKKTEPRTA